MVPEPITRPAGSPDHFQAVRQHLDRMGGDHHDSGRHLPGDIGHDMLDHLGAALEIVESGSRESVLRNAHRDDDHVCGRAVAEVTCEDACRTRIQGGVAQVLHVSLDTVPVPADQDDFTGHPRHQQRVGRRRPHEARPDDRDSRDPRRQPIGCIDCHVNR
jgi:hypothetical protein